MSEAYVTVFEDGDTKRLLDRMIRGGVLAEVDSDRSDHRRFQVTSRGERLLGLAQALCALAEQEHARRQTPAWGRN